MLQSLYIKNFVLIKELDLNFGRGFSVITGETGAGKSILLGALSLVLALAPKQNLSARGTTSASSKLRSRLVLTNCSLFLRKTIWTTAILAFYAANCIVRAKQGNF